MLTISFKLIHVCGGGLLRDKEVNGIQLSMASLVDMDGILLNFHSDSSGTPHLSHVDGRTIVLGDSGGLQNAKYGLKFEPREISQWYNQYVDRGITLDKIPVSFSGAQQSQFEWLGDDLDVLASCAKKTRENTEVMREHQEDYMLYYVYQGDSWDTFNAWHEYSNPQPGEGIATKLRGSYRKNAAVIAFLWEHFRHRPIHILGVGGPRYYAPLILLSKYWDGEITADSARYQWVTRGRTFYSHPVGLSSYNLKGDDASLFMDGDGLPCTCEFCQLVEEHPDGLIEDRGGEECSVFINSMLMAHNIKVEEDRAEYFRHLVHHPEQFKKSCRKLLSSQPNDEESVMEKWDSQRLIEFIFTLGEEGLEAAKEKYEFGQGKMKRWF